MDENEILKERFKSAVSSAVKVISEKFDIEIKFGNDTNVKKKFIKLARNNKPKKFTRFY